MPSQKTLKGSISFSGKGIHTGREVAISLLPAEPNSGIRFRRVDCQPVVEIPVGVNTVLPPDPKMPFRQTTIINGKEYISTVEHLLAAFHGLGIDNAIVEVDAAELPGLDGSSKDYVDKILEAGIQEQASEKKVFVIKEPIFIESEEGYIAAVPANELKISYTLSYKHPSLNDQFASLTITPESFIQNVAPARTFCLREEAELLRSKGYGQGADLTNTLVFENNAPIQNTLRFEDEAARHKILDVLGDLYLAGASIQGHIMAVRTGHQQNFELVKKIIQSQNGKPKLGAVRNAVTESSMKELNIEQIQQILPHRYPFLLVDRIIDIEEGKRAVGIKNVTINDPFFQGHFPGHPIMPGVLIVEALAQVAGVVLLRKPENSGKMAYFMSIDNVKFRKPVTPGDQLRLEIAVIKSKSKTGQCVGKAYVGDKLATEAEFKFSVIES